MIHLKFKFTVNFLKLPLNWTDLCLKLVFENVTAGRNTGCRSVVNCAGCLLQFPLTVSNAVCGIQNVTKQCFSRYHLHTVNQFFHPSPHTITHWAYVWRPGYPIVWNATSDPSPRETIVQKISNFTWRMKRGSVMLQNTYDLVYLKTHPPNVGANPPTEIWGTPLLVSRPSKMKGPIRWSSRNAHHTLTIKRCWKLLSTVTWGFSSA